MSVYPRGNFELLFRKNTEEVLSGLKRTMARKGTIKYIISDSDLAFQNSNRHIRELYNDINLNRIKEELTPKGIAFEFNLPYTPHHNGIVERIVKICKRVLEQKLTRTFISTWNFHTLVCETELLVNMRPIVVTHDDHVEKVITPFELIFLKEADVFPSYHSTRD